MCIVLILNLIVDVDLGEQCEIGGKECKNDCSCPSGYKTSTSVIGSCDADPSNSYNF